MAWFAVRSTGMVSGNDVHGSPYWTQPTAMILPAAQLARIWGLMHPRERIVGFLALFLPILNRIAILGSFGLAMKLIIAAARGEIHPEWRWATALGIVLAFGLAGLLRRTGEQVSLALESSSLRIARRILAENLIKARELPKAQRRRIARRFQKVEDSLARKWSAIQVNLVELAASLAVIGVLMALVTWVLPLIGVIMVGGGILALCYFCIRVKRSRESPPLRGARSELKQLIGRMEKGVKDPRRFVRNFENNSVDRSRAIRRRESRELKSKLSWLVSGGAAVVMVSVFYLASEGWLEGKDPVLLLLFAFALRFSMLQSETVFLKWTLLLKEREAASLLSRVLRGDEGYIGSGSFTIDPASNVEISETEQGE